MARVEVSIGDSIRVAVSSVDDGQEDQRRPGADAGRDDREGDPAGGGDRPGTEAVGHVVEDRRGLLERGADADDRAGQEHDRVGHEQQSEGLVEPAGRPGSTPSPAPARRRSRAARWRRRCCVRPRCSRGAVADGEPGDRQRQTTVSAAPAAPSPREVPAAASSSPTGNAVDEPTDQPVQQAVGRHAERERQRARPAAPATGQRARPERCRSTGRAAPWATRA